MKTLKNLIGAKTLSKKEQINVKGGGIPMSYCVEPGPDNYYTTCPPGQHCEGIYCVLTDPNGGGTNGGGPSQGGLT